MTETATTAGLARDSLPDDGLAEARNRAFEAFETLLVPSQETEEWRYTDLSNLDLGAFSPFASGRKATTLDEVDERILEAVGEAGERSGLLIQHNSETAIVHLDPELERKGVLFESIDSALREHPELVTDRLHTLIPPDRTKFTALQAAYRTGGTLVYVPKGVDVALPLQSLTYVDSAGLAVFPHTLLIVDESASLTFIDRYVSPDLESALSVGAIEIFAGPNSQVRYLSLQDWGRGVTHLSVQRAQIDRDAQVRSLAVTFGADLSRTEVESVLAGPGGHSEMLGVYFTDGSQHFDHRSLQDHIAPHCTSDLLYKGALRDSSRVVYSGLIHIAPGAKGSNAFQTNRNVVLSDEAKADSIPNLEIENNDVKCSHAASVGPVDEDEIFYLQTRGIPRDDAERLIVTGFFQEVLDRVPLEEVRGSLEDAITAELRGK
jgi:Fe-S cluster assembly protein SufD